MAGAAAVRGGGGPAPPRRGGRREPPASDVVLILEKQRVALGALEVALRGTRREEQPRRYTALHFVFTISGVGVDETKVRRAIDLSLEKYCSVVASLAPD